MTQYLVKWKPGSSQEKIIKNSNNELTIYLRAKPHDGEANEALIKLLSKYFDTPKTSIKIVHGAKSRNKTIEF